MSSFFQMWLGRPEGVALRSFFFIGNSKGDIAVAVFIFPFISFRVVFLKFGVGCTLPPPLFNSAGYFTDRMLREMFREGFDQALVFGSLCELPKLRAIKMIDFITFGPLSSCSESS